MAEADAMYEEAAMEDAEEANGNVVVHGDAPLVVENMPPYPLPDGDDEQSDDVVLGVDEDNEDFDVEIDEGSEVYMDEDDDSEDADNTSDSDDDDSNDDSDEESAASDAYHWGDHVRARDAFVYADEDSDSDSEDDDDDDSEEEAGQRTERSRRSAMVRARRTILHFLRSER